MSGDNEAESPFFGEGGNVWSSHSCAMLVNAQQMRPALDPRGDAVSGCWSTTTAEAHRSTARPGKGQLVCSTGLRKEREGAPPAVGLRGAL